MAGLQNMQEFIPVRTPVANEKLSEGMLSWSLVLPPVSNIIQIASVTKKDITPVKIQRHISPFTTTVGGSTLTAKDFQYSTVNATPPSTPPAGTGDTTGQTGNPSTTGGTAATAPVPVTNNDVPVSYAVYTFKPTITNSVATVTQIRSISLSLSYYLPDWTFAIWIPSIQRYIEYVPSAISDVPDAWVTINAATNVEASGTASVEFIFGLRTAQLTDLTAPYGSIQVMNYKVDEHLFVSRLGGEGGSGGMVYPAAGVAVSTGTGWDTSLTASDIAMTNEAVTFQDTVTMQNDLTVDGNTYLDGTLNANAINATSLLVNNVPVVTQPGIIEFIFRSPVQGWNNATTYIGSQNTIIGNLFTGATGNSVAWSPVDCQTMYLYLIATSTVAGSSPSAEGATITMWRYNSTDGWVEFLTGATMSWHSSAAATTFAVIDLSGAVGGAIKAGDTMTFNIQTPTWATPPTSLIFSGILMCKVTGVIQGGITLPVPAALDLVGV